MRLLDTTLPMRGFVTYIAYLVLMVSASFLITRMGVAMAQERPSIYEMSFVPLAVSVKGDNGGNIAQYILNTEEYRAAQTQVSFAGRCDSACTLYLGLAPEQICIRPQAYFRFHAPTAKSQSVQGLAMAVLMERYPDWVRDWILLRGGLTRRLMTMDAAYARQFVRPCTELALQ
jgi:hypothetical protein